MLATAESPAGLSTIRDLIPKGVLPDNFADANANEIALKGLEKLKAAAQPNPVTERKAIPTSNPTPAVPDIKEPVVPVVPAVKDPVTTDLAPEFADDKLLSALEAEQPAAPTTETGSPKEPVIPALTSEDPEAPIEIPKSAKDMQKALITTSKLLREKEKKIKELEAKGNVDMAALAQEPLKQKIAQYETEIAQLRNVAASASLESIPEIQAHILRPLQVAEQFINDTAKANDGVSPRELFKAAQEPDALKRKAAVRAACSDLHPSDALQVEYAVDAIFQKNADYIKVKANASQIMAERQRQQQEQVSAQQAQVRTASLKAHDESFKALMGDPVLSQFASDPTTKKNFDAVLEQAKAAELDTAWVQDHGKRSLALQKAFAYDPTVAAYRKKLGEVLKQNKDLLAQNLKLKAPGLSTQPRSAYVAPITDKPQSTEQLVKGAFKGLL